MAVALRAVVSENSCRECAQRQPGHAGPVCLAALCEL